MPKNRTNIRPFYFLFNTRGMDENDGVFFLQPDAAVLIENLHATKRGQFSSHAQGNSNFSGPFESGSRVDAAGYFRDDNGIGYLLCSVNGNVHHIHPETGSDLAVISSTGSPGNYMDFQTFKGSVYMADGTITPKQWLGTGTASSVSGLPLTVGSDSYDLPRLVETYANRLIYGSFQGGEKFPAHIAISDTLAPDTFTLGVNDSDGAVIQINPGDGEALTAMKSIYVPALDQNYLVCWKEHSIYALSGTTPETFHVIQLNSSFGCLNNRCVVPVGADVLFMDQNNIYSLSTATQSGNLQPKAIGSDSVRETLQTMNLTQKDKAWAIHLPDRREVWFGIPTGASTEVDTILIYRYSDQIDGQPIWSLRKGMNATCAVRINNTLLTGTSNGILQKWFGTSNYAGTGYNWIYRFPYFGFGSQGQHKRVVDLFAWFFVRANTTITFKTKWRGGGNNTEQTLTKSITQNDTATYGDAVFGSDYYSSSDGRLVKVKIPVYGNGEQLQLEVSGTTGSVGTDFLGFSGLIEFLDYSRSYAS